MDIFIPFYLGFTVMRTIYYPLKDLFGETFCHIFAFTEMSAVMTAQFHSFFLTLFRYICLFHEDVLIKRNILPKVKQLQQMLFFFFIVILFSCSHLRDLSWLLITSCLGSFQHFWFWVRIPYELIIPVLVVQNWTFSIRKATNFALQIAIGFCIIYVE